MKITYTDGTEETLNKADIDCSEEENSFYVFKDEEEEIILEVNIDSIKKIRWD